ncbi:ATP-binding cassette sub-family A member 1 [Aphelenchoides besseyi]|nr:ATP-binding cassette sub-family A member 1 [Aphelenchoides besseyi]KAI6218122.1 ATP-binding cassette sub-family A member 1 [Aphelenchoides besseyi]
MLSVWRQFLLLLWKAYIIKRKQKILVFIEILIPTLLFLLVVLIRTRNFDVDAPVCHYDSKPFPSAGVLPFAHGFFCSYMNNCSQVPTTGDEKIVINNSTRESSAVNGIRWLTDLFYYLGYQTEAWNVIFDQFAFWIHTVSEAQHDTDSRKRYPFHLLFASESEMDEVLREGLEYEDEDVEKFNNLYLTPLFPICIYDAYSQYQKSDPLTMWSSPIDTLCDPNKLNLCFEGEGFNVTELDLCKISFSYLTLAYAGYAENFDTNNLPIRFFEHNRPNFMSNIPEHIQPSFTTTGLSVLFTHFPLPHFLRGYNQSSMLDALFCGSFKEVLNNENNKFGIVFNPNSVLVSIKRKLMDFIQDAMPSETRSGKEVCGNITVHELNHCSHNILNFKMARSMIQGYILVSPDTPLVRSIIEPLNEPFRYLNLLRDMTVDLNNLAFDLQDEMAASNLSVAAENLAKNLLDHGLIDNETASALEHAFGNSTDKRSLFPQIKGILDTIVNATSCIRLNRFIFVDDEHELEKLAICLGDYSEYFTSIVFPDLNSTVHELPPMVKYKIRHQPRLVDSTSAIADLWSVIARDNPLIDLKYLTFGFVFLQEQLESRIVEHVTNSTLRVGVYAQQEPYPCTKSDSFNITIFLSLFVMLSWMTPAALLVKNIVYEKEMRLKEMMRIMGLGDVIHWLAWAFQTIVFNVISILIISTLLKYGRILPHTDLSLLMVILFLFSFACAAQCVYLSTFFSRANLATACTALLFFLMFIPFQLSIRSNNFTFTMLTLILPQSAIGYGFTMIAFAEDGKMAKWATLDQIGLEEYHVKFIHVLVALVIDVVIYSILAWYISAVFPGAYGVSQPFYFCFSRSYWRGIGSNPLEGLRSSGCIFSETSSDIEPMPPSQKMAVEIRDMVKIYDNNTKALDSLNVRFYENQITGFLGHNGAGKTTTMSILCGLYSPTSGTASVYGKDIRRDMPAIRDHLGVCPQHNILFDNMTVEEQLQFYGRLKGVPNSRLNHEVELFLKDIGLTDKRYALSNQLSGGMKRKLCIGIALIGGSKLVILDEPTAGIDAHARRGIWSLLIKHKENRTILLSTHHMDEADVLSDRIAIISEGQLKTAGSSMFLKKRFGKGFCLSVVKSPSVVNSERRQSSQSTRNNSTVETVRSRMDSFLVTHGYKEIKLIEDLGVELEYLMPLDLSTNRLTGFFEKLESSKQQLEIESYGFSAPSLQQIFLTIAPHREIILKKYPGILTRLKRWCCCWGRSRNYVATDIIKSANAIDIDSNGLVKEDEEEDIVHPPMSFVKSLLVLRSQQTRALFLKRIHISRRNLVPIFVELLLPIIVLFIAEIYAKTQIENRDTKFMVAQKPLDLTSALYGNGTTYYTAVWNQNSSSAINYYNALTSDPGPGIRCVENANLKSHSGRPMDCIDGSATQMLNFTADRNVSYNVPQTCGCMDTVGWNCTTKDDFPIDSLQKTIFNTTDRLYDLNDRNISQFRLITFDNTTEMKPALLGGWTFGHRNQHGLTGEDLKYIKKGFRASWSIFTNLSMSLSFDWQKVLNETPLVTENDTFVPNNPTVIDSIEQIFDYLDIEEGVKVWFNNKAWAALPVNVNSFYNAALRSRLRPDQSPNKFGIYAINHPMNDTAENILNSAAIQKSGTFRVVLMTLALCVITARFSVFLVNENSSRSKHLQRVFGINPWLYHTVNFIYDFTFYFACVILMIFMYWSIGTELFTFTFEALVTSVIMFIVYGLCILPFIYICQMFFSVPSMAFAIISIGLFLFGVVSTTSVMLLENLQTSDEGLEIANNICSIVFLIIPPYNLGMAINRLSFIHNLRIFGTKFLENIGRPDLAHELPIPLMSEWELMGKHISCLCFSAIFYLTVLMIIEYRDVLFKFMRVFEKKKTIQLYEEQVNSGMLDEDVKTEQRMVEEMDEYDGYGVVVKKLCKTYNKQDLAVKGITFSVANGECFGLLGVNGAGKTTTFSMLTGSLSIGSGDIVVCGSSIVKNNFLSLRDIGYCPQFDALNMKLTVREHLIFYARIRGVCEIDIDETVHWAIGHMKLKPYANETAESLSGGNKRKLSAAIALISDPPVVLLDEPSAGMDPSSQQFMWNLILQLRRTGRTVIITSHSMEECEALCTRTAIMVEGQFQCIGSITHLKEKFGDGYTLTIKAAKQKDIDAIKEKLSEILPKAELISIHMHTFFYRVRGSSTVLPYLFKGIALLQELYTIEDYSITQTSLDDVFVSFAAASSTKKTSNETENGKTNGTASEETGTIERTTL